MTLSILQVNAWLLPPPFSAENDQRLDELIRLIRAKRPQVVTLQEIWLHRFVRKLRKELQEYRIVTSKRSRWYNHSGLVTLTRLPLLRTRFRKFSTSVHHRFIEKLAQKGTLETVVQFRKRLVTIVNTHLYNPRLVGEHAIRNRQLQSIERLRGTLMVVSGDLNIRREELRAQLRKQWEHERHNYLQQRSKYESARSNRHQTSNKGLVYLLSNGFRTVRAQALRKPVLSDHFVLYSILRL